MLHSRLVLLLVPILVLTGFSQSSSPVDIQFNFSRWPYPLYVEVSGRLHELARQYPTLAQLQTIGKSGEGRDLLVMEITNHDTGPGESKPGLWIDGNIHADELSGRPILMYFIQRLLASYGRDQEATRLLDTRTFYVMPMFDVDGGERALTAEPAWPGYKASEHEGKDLDGDGYITQMRVKDPHGDWYPSPVDPRIMVKVRDHTGGRWNYISTTYGGNLVFNLNEPNIGWQPTGNVSGTFEDPLAPPEKRYRLYVEGEDINRPVNLEPGRANFNRNWSAEWRPEEPGAGPFPFSLPEVRSVAQFITSHRNIFFDFSFHTDDTVKNYLVRPPMNHPYESLPPEDNEFYNRVGAKWSGVSGGSIIENNYSSQELMTGQYGETMHGFENDWAYLQAGLFSLISEVSSKSGKDYDGDGFVTEAEVLRWNDEEKSGRYFAQWKPYKHPLLGDIEIGGERGMPQPIDDQLKNDCLTYYRYLLYLSNLSPLLSIKDLRAERLLNDQYRIVAILQNHGFLSTYVTRKALETRRDYPVVVEIRVSGGTVTAGEPLQQVGHILGHLAYFWRWGTGADESTREVEWTIKPTGKVPTQVSVEAWAPKAGRDQRSITVGTTSPR